MTWKPAVVLAMWLAVLDARAGEIFDVPGHEKEFARIEELFRLHRVVGPDTTLWDPWVPMSVLWLDTMAAPSTGTIRETYRTRLLQRRIDAEGYVSTQQHEGLAHSQGWPFPLWTQAGGVGWHFSLQGVPYNSGYGVLLSTNVDAWTLTGATTLSLNPNDGWSVQLGQPGSENPNESTLVSPVIRLDASVAPFLRLKWAGRRFGPGTSIRLDWQTAGDPDFQAQRSFFCNLPGSDGGVEDTDLPLFRHPQWTGRITRLRLTGRPSLRRTKAQTIR